MTNLSNMKTSDLVALYNEHSNKPAITKWKRKVSDLVALLVALKPELFTADAPATTDEAPLAPMTPEMTAAVDEAKELAAHFKAEKPKKAKATKVKAEKPASDRGAIRRYSEELLLKVKGTDPETKRPLGLPYGDILEAVTKKFPEAQTSLNCLRWYATKMNKRTGDEKVQMPIRPKAKVAA